MFDDGTRRIRLAAGAAAQREDAAIRRILACAPRRSPGEMDHVERIKRAAGEPTDNQEPLMTKAMVMGATLGRLEGLLKALEVRVPACHAASVPSRGPAVSPRPRQFVPPTRPVAAAVPSRLRRPRSPNSSLAFWDARDSLASAIRAGRVRPTPAALTDHVVAQHGIGHADASEWTERFLGGLQRDLDRKGGRL